MLLSVWQLQIYLGESASVLRSDCLIFQCPKDQSQLLIWSAAQVFSAGAQLQSLNHEKKNNADMPDVLLFFKQQQQKKSF